MSQYPLNISDAADNPIGDQSERAETPNVITTNANPPMLNEDKLRESLRQVVDPEIGMDVIALGLIRELDINPDRVHVKMMLTTPFCPYGPQMLEQVRRNVQDTSGVPTTVELTMEVWDPSMMEEGAGQEWGLFY